MLANPMNQTRESLLSKFLSDAHRFLQSHCHVCKLAPLQLYSSARIFSPKNSIGRLLCNTQLDWISQAPVVASDWSHVLQVLEGHTAQVTAVAFSPDQLMIASLSDDNTARLWSVSSGQQIQQINLDTPNSRCGRCEDHQSYENDLAIPGIAFSPDSKVLAIVRNRSRRVELWLVATAQLIEDTGSGECTLEACPIVYKVGRTLRTVIAFLTGSSKTWQISRGQAVNTLDANFNGLQFNSDGQLEGRRATSLTKLSLSAVKIWSLGYTNIRTSLYNWGAECLAIAISHARDVYATIGSNDHTIRISRISTDEMLGYFNGAVQNIKGLTFSPDGALLTIADSNGLLQICQVALWRGDHEEKQHSSAGTECVSKMSYSPDGSLLAARTSNGRLTLWQPDTGRYDPNLSYESYIHGSSSVRLSLDGSLIAWADVFDDYSGVKVWNVKTRSLTCHQKFRHGLGCTLQLEFYLLGTSLALSSNSTVQLLHLDIDGCIEPEVPPRLMGKSGLHILALSNDRSLAATRSLRGWNGELYFWDVATAQKLFSVHVTRNSFTLSKHRQSGHEGCVAISPDNTVVALATGQGDLTLHEVATERQLMHVSCPYEISYMRFTKNGLWTDQGVVVFEDMKFHRPVCRWIEPLRVKGEWIEYKGERVLWLPQEYRRAKHCIYQGQIAFGHIDGKVNFVKIDLDKCLEA